MTRITLLVSTLLIALASSFVVADHHNGDNKDAYFNDILRPLDLDEAERKEVHQVLTEFHQDREQAEKALSELGKSLPPREEVRAMRAYSDTVLEGRLSEVLESGQVAKVMNAIQEQRQMDQEN